GTQRSSSNSKVGRVTGRPRGIGPARRGLYLRRDGDSRFRDVRSVERSIIGPPVEEAGVPTRGPRPRVSDQPFRAGPPSGPEAAWVSPLLHRASANGWAGICRLGNTLRAPLPRAVARALDRTATPPRGQDRATLPERAGGRTGVFLYPLGIKNP